MFMFLFGMLAGVDLCEEQVVEDAQQQISYAIPMGCFCAPTHTYEACEICCRGCGNGACGNDPACFTRWYLRCMRESCYDQSIRSFPLTCQ